MFKRDRSPVEKLRERVPMVDSTDSNHVPSKRTMLMLLLSFFIIAVIVKIVRSR